MMTFACLIAFLLSSGCAAVMLVMADEFTLPRWLSLCFVFGFVIVVWGLIIQGVVQ